MLAVRYARHNGAVTPGRFRLAIATAAALTGLAAGASWPAGATSAAGSVRAGACPAPQQPPAETQIRRPRWLASVLITEYFPAPERFFDGRLVRAPGLPGRHRIDWLYSARGLAMQGEGIGLDGRFYHFAGPYSLTWRTTSGHTTYPCRLAPGYWTNGSPAWIGPTALSASHAVTYPLGAGGWSGGPPAVTIGAAASATFAAGPALRLTYWRDAAVDPRLIPAGSHLFVPAYCSSPGHGWLTAADQGGAIIGRHIDVFRAPPTTTWSSSVLRDQRIYVVPPGFARPAAAHCR